MKLTSLINQSEFGFANWNTIKKWNRKAEENKSYKMKTNKATAKRFWIRGTRRNKVFVHNRVGFQHLMRNKSSTALSKSSWNKELTCKGDIKRIKKLMPYWKRRKYLI